MTGTALLLAIATLAGSVAAGPMVRRDDGRVDLVVGRRGASPKYQEAMSNLMARHSQHRRQLTEPSLSAVPPKPTDSSNITVSASKDRTSAPLINWRRSLGYTVNVALGTPPQHFDLLVDTGSPDLWVFDESCRGDCAGGAFFQHGISTTMRSTNKELMLKYLKGENDGVYVTEVVTIADQTVYDMEIGLVDYALDTGFDKTNISGILGMSFPFPDYSGTPYADQVTYHADPFWYHLVDHWTNKEFGLYLARDPTTLDRSTAKSIENGGQLSLGGVDSSLFQGEINYVPIQATAEELSLPYAGGGSSSVGGASINSTSGTNNPLYWSVPFDGMTVNGRDVSPGRRNGNDIAVIDSGSTIILGPPSAVTAFYGEIDGAMSTYDASYGGRLWTFPCKDLPKIKVSFNFGGQKYNIESSDLVLAVEPGGLCAGAVQTFDKDMNQSWLIGDTFLTNVYSTYRADPPAVGFAPLTDSANIKYKGQYSGSGFVIRSSIVAVLSGVVAAFMLV